MGTDMLESCWLGISRSPSPISKHFRWVLSSCGSNKTTEPNWPNFGVIRHCTQATCPARMMTPPFRRPHSSSSAVRITSIRVLCLLIWDKLTVHPSNGIRISINHIYLQIFPHPSRSCNGLTSISGRYFSFHTRSTMLTTTIHFAVTGCPSAVAGSRFPAMWTVLSPFSCTLWTAQFCSGWWAQRSQSLIFITCDLHDMS